MEHAHIFNIQRYSIQDGPGIRTTVFFKGCTLRCQWCSNPESIFRQPEVMIEGMLCSGCRSCIEACPLDCMTYDENKGKPVIDRKTCDSCMKCVDVCKTGALRKMGELMTVDQVMSEIKQDSLYYKNSKGGVTLSGGEALSQKDFVLELLKACRHEHIHTAIDTCGHVSWELFEDVLNYVDLVLYDLKHMNSEKHNEGTGAYNEMILENAQRIAEKGKRMWIRVPVIPGYNDDEENLLATANFAAKLNAEKLSLLGFFNFAKVKYESLDRKYPLDNIEPLEKETLNRLKQKIDEIGSGLQITIGH